MSRAVHTCQRCRHQILDSFAAIAGLSLRPLPQLSRPRIACSTQPRAARFYSTSSPWRQSQQDGTVSSGNDKNHQQQTSIPWYLQVETPTPPAPNTTPFLSQEIPPVPSDAPSILSPILYHLSDQIGLDNLSLLDLRHLDPPPALGANLIMIIGTARSYKHLNTSADRFCRWLRSRYKLRPYADGLLGRNELKLKLRRKARKMKLAQSVGNTVAMSDADDGITTGWICVNMGNVDDAMIPEDEKTSETDKLTQAQQEEAEAEEAEYENPEGDGYIGFGSRSQASKIVVQMFTEEKRLEMDLEGLWDIRMQRKARKAQKADAKLGDDVEEHVLENHTRRAEGDFSPFSTVR